MRDAEKLQRMGLTITQAAYLLEIEPTVLVRALDQRETPQWLQYCLNGMAEEHKEDPEAFEFFRLGAQLRERTWSAMTARAAIPVLIEQAQKGELISYGELDAELRRRDPSRESAGILTKMGKPLGIIGDVIEEIRAEAEDSTSPVPIENSKMPPLEALCVRGREQLPGRGIDDFLIKFLSILGERAPEDHMLRDQDRKAAVQRIHGEIWKWTDWSMLDRLARR